MVCKLPISGDVRTIHRFTILPTVVDDEVFWSESIIVHQSYNTQRRGWNNELAEQLNQKGGTTWT